MNVKLKGYIKTEAIVSAFLNFFINGIIAFLIYNKLDYVPTNVISISIDLLLTCILIFIISAFFVGQVFYGQKQQACLKATTT